jgi:hypothetical protein
MKRTSQSTRVYELDTTGGVWKSRTRMPKALFDHAAAVLDNDTVTHTHSPSKCK